MRKDKLITGETYHIFTRSIADFKIFNNKKDFERMQQLMKYYQVENELRLSDFIELKIVRREGFNNAFNLISKNKEKSVQIIAFCLMPTHIHLVIKQLIDDGITIFIKDILNSYTRYFNIKYQRKGPLWETRFKSVLVNSNEQLLHLTRYIHLNPVTAQLIDHPEDWDFSSYKEYIGEISESSAICRFKDLMEIQPLLYSKFVEDHISYQRELAKIKNLLID